MYNFIVAFPFLLSVVITKVSWKELWRKRKSTKWCDSCIFKSFNFKIYLLNHAYIRGKPVFINRPKSWYNIIYFFAFIQQERKLKAAIWSGQYILFICYRWIVSNKKSLEIANIFLSIFAMPSSEFLNNPFLSWIFCQFTSVNYYNHSPNFRIPHIT